jgi:hypothetical protein
VFLHLAVTAHAPYKGACQLHPACSIAVFLVRYAGVLPTILK